MTHGISGYVNRGCRCETCRTAKSRAAKKYYEANKGDVLRSNAARRDRNLSDYRVRDARRYEANGSKLRRQSRERYASNRDEIIDYQRNYRSLRSGSVNAERRRKNANSIRLATRHNCAWTDAEDRICMRAGLSITELASILNRSIEGVKNRRHKLRKGNLTP